MTRRLRTAALAALGASCVLSPLSVGEAVASPVETVLSGGLAVAVPPAASLATSGSTISGSLGTTSVIDGRIASPGYSVSMSTGGFDLVGPAITSDPLTHIPASAVTVQVTATTGGTASTTAPVALPSALPIFTLTYGGAVTIVDLLSSYTVSMTIAAPVAAAQGRYVGTVTQTVV